MNEYSWNLVHSDEETFYGVPEQKKFPLDSRAHVISAVKFFNYVDPRYEKALARRLIAKIHQYHIALTPTETNRFYKYYRPKRRCFMNEYYCAFLEPTPYDLQHHGIKGMRWGVRRYQNPDGTYTAAGRSRYGYGNGRSRSSTESSESNGKTKKKKGLTTGQKVAIGVGAAAGAAALGYGIYRLNKAGAFDDIKDAGKEGVSKVVNNPKAFSYKKTTKSSIVGSSDNPLYRVQTGKKDLQNANDAIFSTDSMKNNSFYKKWMYEHRNDKTRISDLKDNPVYNLEITYNEGRGVNKASDTEAQRVFNEMRKNNPEFRKAVREMPDSLDKSGNIHKKFSAGYDRFNINLGGKGRETKAGKMYLEEMSKRGFNAITDLNDTMYNRGQRKNGLSALITFGAEANVESTRVTGEEIQSIIDLGKKSKIRI